MPWQTIKLLKSRVDNDLSIPEPSESSVHGKEIYVAKQQQTQKEVIYDAFIYLNNLLTITLFFQVQGNTEIHRKITATETTEMEHTRKNQERVVQEKIVCTFYQKFKQVLKKYLFMHIFMQRILGTG